MNAEIEATCPNPQCRATFRVDRQRAGRIVRCEKCGAEFVAGSQATLVLSAAEEAAPAAAPAGGDEEWQTGAVLLGEYEVEGPLGRGGMGAVYLVRSRSTGRHFAAKSILPQLVSEEGKRRLFLRELQTWIDLPDHPNLTACRFFRTVEDRIVIFADYVDGGSVAEWIRDGRLTTLAQILDVAVQFAWGLDVTHQRGVLHRDVKPANVLMTADGIAKVTDFGLAGAAGGMTPAYASPEQSGGRQLTVQSDIWSWGASVLEMFSGQVTWPRGAVAGRALEALLESDRREPQRAAMPACVADVLRKCFQADPADRWGGIAQAADALIVAYRAETGADYPRRPVTAVYRWSEAFRDRFVSGGAEWTDPHLWLERALRADGRDPTEADELLASREGSARAQVIADLAGYAEARRIFERLIAGGRKELEAELGVLLNEAAWVHGTAGDREGALGLFDRAIEMWDRLVNRDGRRDLADCLARALLYKSGVAWAAGDAAMTSDLADRAAAIYEPLVYQQGRTELTSELAMSHMNKGVALMNAGQAQRALGLLDRATETYARLVNEDGRRDLAFQLAMTLENRAAAFVRLQDHRAALAAIESAIEINRSLVEEEGRAELTNMLARTYLAKGAALAGLGDVRSALEFYDKAVALYGVVVDQQGRPELATQLAKSCVLDGEASIALGQPVRAAEVLDRAITILDRVVNQEAGGNWAFLLANAYRLRAEVHIASGDFPTAAAWLDAAIPIHEGLVSAGRLDQRENLAADYQSRGALLDRTGDKQSALAMFGKARELYEALVLREGRGDLAGALGLTYTNVGLMLAALGDLDSAARFHHSAAETYERLLRQEGQWSFAGGLVRAYVHSGCCQLALGDVAGAAATFERAGAVADRLVDEEGKREFRDVQALAYLNRGAAAMAAGDGSAALAHYDRAVRIYEQLVRNEGRSDLRELMAKACVNSSAILIDRQDSRRAEALARGAVEITSQLAYREGRGDLTGEVGRAKALRAVSLLGLGDRPGAQREGREGIAILQAEVARGRADLQKPLNWARRALHEVL